MLRTQRLTLKPYRKRDRQNMIELLTNEQIKKTFMIPDFATRREAVAAFDKLYEYAHSDAHYEMGVYLDDAMIGFFNDVEIGDGFIEVGYVIHPAHQGRGYATEALAAVLGDLFDRGFREVRTAAFRHNLPSRRVMEKCGMRMTDETESYLYHGKQEECVCYAIEQEAWRERDARP